MKIGTRSLLFGCHQFLIHPCYVLRAWIKLYGRPNWKELICIIIHDWGYWGSPNMDGEEGEDHPEWAADFLEKLWGYSNEWSALCIFHSRFYAMKCQTRPSHLCWADKLGTALMPAWLWVWLGKMSGEIDEYMGHKKYEIYKQDASCPYKWFRDYQALVIGLLAENGVVERKQS